MSLDPLEATCVPCDWPAGVYKPYPFPARIRPCDFGARQCPHPTAQAMTLAANLAVGLIDDLQVHSLAPA